MGVELRPRQRAFTHLGVVSATHVHGAGGIRLRREGLGGCNTCFEGSVRAPELCRVTRARLVVHQVQHSVAEPAVQLRIHVHVLAVRAQEGGEVGLVVEGSDSHSGAL
jgi:hypothetical protein